MLDTFGYIAACCASGISAMVPRPAGETQERCHGLMALEVLTEASPAPGGRRELRTASILLLCHPGPGGSSYGCDLRCF